MLTYKILYTQKDIEVKFMSEIKIVYIFYQQFKIWKALGKWVLISKYPRIPETIAKQLILLYADLFRIKDGFESRGYFK